MSRVGAPVESAVVGAMVATIRHRGPDDEGIFVEANVGLGHTRLSIIDLSAAGHQPMRDASGQIVIVFNGEIYNYPELRQELLAEGTPLQSHSDTEVILYLYRKHGTNCLKYLRGMFAFAIWDRTAKRLFIARDRIGIKPLYYYLDDDWFAFGSELKAIYEIPGLNRDLSFEAISTFFAYAHSFAPQTIFKKVRKLLPGCWMLLEADRVVTKRYWDVTTISEVNIGFTRQSEILQGLLADSVKCHLIADVPVGVFLSGGIDSSLIAALAAADGRQPQTFSVGFDVGGYYNELDAAKVMARRISSDHHEYIVRGVDVPALLEKLVWHYDEPFADAAAIPTYLISQFARQWVKVVLSGEGGDELYGGYRRYITQLLSRYYQWLRCLVGPGLPLRKIVAARNGLRRVKKVLESVDYSDQADRYAHWLTTFTSPMRQELFAGAMRQFDHNHDVMQRYREQLAATGNDRLNRLLKVDFLTWLPDTYLEKVDKASMAVGLEARVPFLDHPVVEHAFSIPGNYKISRLRKKFILRAAASSLVPPKILNKPKHGFAVPLDDWFRGSLLGYAREILLDERVKRRGYFDTGAIESLINAHVRGYSDYGTHIWQLLNFELWHRRFVDTKPALSTVGPGPGDLTQTACI